MKVHCISLVGDESVNKGIHAFEEILKEDGFILVKSKISVGMTNFEQKYYVSSNEPGSFIVITELVFHLQIEAVRIKGDANHWLRGYLNKSQRKLKAA